MFEWVVEISKQVRGLCLRGRGRFLNRLEDCVWMGGEISKQVREEWTAWTVCRKYVKKLWGVKLIHEDL